MEHAKDELVLLYVVQLSARYLRAFVAMTDRPPKVGLAHRDRLNYAITYGLAQSDHLWFLTDEPTMYDRTDELVTRAGDQRTFTHHTPADAVALDPSEVRYYRNPLERLRKMHMSVPIDFAIGFGYMSPWK